MHEPGVRRITAHAKLGRSVDDKIIAVTPPAFVHEPGMSKFLGSAPAPRLRLKSNVRKVKQRQGPPSHFFGCIQNAGVEMDLENSHESRAFLRERYEDLHTCPLGTEAHPANVD